MKRLILPLFFFMSLSCEKKENDCPTNTYTYTVTANSKIDTLTTMDSAFIATVTNGDNLAFKYLYEHVECKNIADADWGQELIFEVPANSESFSYHKADFETRKCYYLPFASYTLIQSSILPEDGSMAGIKLNSNTWKVSIDIKIDSNRTIKSTENFVVK